MQPYIESGGGCSASEGCKLCILLVRSYHVSSTSKRDDCIGGTNKQDFGIIWRYDVLSTSVPGAASSSCIVVACCPVDVPRAAADDRQGSTRPKRKGG